MKEDLVIAQLVQIEVLAVLVIQVVSVQAEIVETGDVMVIIVILGATVLALITEAKAVHVLQMANV